MLRQPSTWARLLGSLTGQQRRLLALVFLWTCLCLLLFRSSSIERNVPAIAADDSQPHNSQALLQSSSLGPNFEAPQVAPLDAQSSSSSPPSLLGPRPLSEQLQKRDSTSDNSISDQQQLKQQHKSQPHQRAQVPNSTLQPNRSASSDTAPIAGSQCRYDYPRLFDLQFNNIHWQKLSSPETNKSSAVRTPVNYYLYNAYYDDRWRGGTPTVRVLAMIDRIRPPETNCLLWSRKLRRSEIQAASAASQLVPLVVRAQFVYAWYPNWGNYNDGILQPWIVTCPLPHDHAGLVPESISLTAVPPPVDHTNTLDDAYQLDSSRRRRDTEQQPAPQAMVAQSIAMPPASSSSAPIAAQSSKPEAKDEELNSPLAAAKTIEYDCKATLPITNNLPVFNQRPQVKQKFAVCVKGLDFPHEDISVRLVEWIELLNLLGASKIFLYVLNVHENISKVLHYYSERGLVELIPLTLPGDQPNLPEYQHLYLKNKMTTKRQNELIPYNDCLYRNLYSYQYLALLDIDEIIMPLKHHSWFQLMDEVEKISLAEQNYSRASYNTRNVYFFDDLAGPLGTTSSSTSNSADHSVETKNDSLESGIPYYLHMMQHVYRSKNYTKPGQYVKCFHNTDRVVSLHNHFPMNCFGQCTTYSIPIKLAHLQHYRKDCVGPLKRSCKSEFRLYTTRDVTIWRYKQQMIRRTTRVLNHLDLLGGNVKHRSIDQ